MRSPTPVLAMPVWGGAQRGPEHAAAGLSVCPNDLRLALHKRYRLQPPSWSKTLPAPDPPLTHRLEDDHGRLRAHRTLQKGSRIWAFMGPRDVVPLGDNRPRVTELTGRHLGVLARREHGGRGPRRRRKELVALTDGYRESTESWAGLLRDCRRPGMPARFWRWATARRVLGRAAGRVSRDPRAAVLIPHVGECACGAAEVGSPWRDQGDATDLQRRRHRPYFGSPSPGAVTRGPTTIPARSPVGCSRLKFARSMGDQVMTAPSSWISRAGNAAGSVAQGRSFPAPTVGAPAARGLAQSGGVHLVPPDAPSATTLLPSCSDFVPDSRLRAGHSLANIRTVLEGIQVPASFGGPAAGALAFRYDERGPGDR